MKSVKICISTVFEAGFLFFVVAVVSEVKHKGGQTFPKVPVVSLKSDKADGERQNNTLGKKNNTLPINSPSFIDQMEGGHFTKGYSSPRLAIPRAHPTWETPHLNKGKRRADVALNLNSNSLLCTRCTHLDCKCPPCFEMLSGCTAIPSEIYL